MKDSGMQTRSRWILTRILMTSSRQSWKFFKMFKTSLVKLTMIHGCLMMKRIKKGEIFIEKLMR